MIFLFIYTKLILSSFLLLLAAHVGVTTGPLCLDLTLSPASSSATAVLCMSSLTASMNLLCVSKPTVFPQLLLNKALINPIWKSHSWWSAYSVSQRCSSKIASWCVSASTLILLTTSSKLTCLASSSTEFVYMVWIKSNQWALGNSPCCLLQGYSADTAH